jgi:hypothetical protein
MEGNCEFTYHHNPEKEILWAGRTPVHDSSPASGHPTCTSTMQSDLNADLHNLHKVWRSVSTLFALVSAINHSGNLCLSNACSLVLEPSTCLPENLQWMLFLRALSIILVRNGEVVSVAAAPVAEVAEVTNHAPISNLKPYLTFSNDDLTFSKIIITLNPCHKPYPDRFFSPDHGTCTMVNSDSMVSHLPVIETGSWPALLAIP